MIVLDNTVLTSLAHIDFLRIPFDLFGEVVIPESVYNEGIKEATHPVRVKRIKKALEQDHIKIISCEKREKHRADEYNRKFGPGESSCLAIAEYRNCLLGTDDLKARKIAKKNSIDVIGTLGILRLGYKNSELNGKELKKAISKIDEILYFTDDLKEWALSVVD